MVSNWFDRHRALAVSLTSAGVGMAPMIVSPFASWLLTPVFTGGLMLGCAAVHRGEPFAEQLVMSWNFVGRTRDEVRVAADDWNAQHTRFGTVDSVLARIPAPSSRG